MDSNPEQTQYQLRFIQNEKDIADLRLAIKDLQTHNMQYPIKDLLARFEKIESRLKELERPKIPQIDITSKPSTSITSNLPKKNPFRFW